MEKKITKKEHALRFVESKGTARFVEIQEFIVNLNRGKDAYKNGWRLEVIYLHGERGCGNSTQTCGFVNPNRGYYSSAFCGPNPWFIYGEDYLEKQPDGSYKTIRGGNKPKPEYHNHWGSYYRNYNQRLC